MSSEPWPAGYRQVRWLFGISCAVPVMSCPASFRLVSTGAGAPLPCQQDGTLFVNVCRFCGQPRECYTLAFTRRDTSCYDDHDTATAGDTDKQPKAVLLREKNRRVGASWPGTKENGGGDVVKGNPHDSPQASLVHSLVHAVDPSIELHRC